MWEMDPKTLQEFQEKKIREIVNYAYYNVPFYRKKYQEANFNPKDIETIDDFKKIPFVTKEDLQNTSLEDLRPSTIKKEAMITTTSGTIGKPLSIYITLFDIVQGLFGYLRPFKEYDISWRKDRIALIVDLRMGSVERKYLNEGVFPSFKPLISFDNIRVFSLKDKAEKLINELDEFQPDFIGSYPGKLTHLALLKEKGFGENINPKAIGTTGELFDKHLRALAEEAFNTNVYDTYGATETGPIAFECRKKKMHIDVDLIYAEFLKDGKPTVGEEPGNIVVTKLFGKGTPIIRYSGINDIVAPSNETCECGLRHSLIKKIYGRDNLYLIFPGGKIMLQSAISEIFGRAVYEYRTRMFKDIQIVQHGLDQIEIKVVIDHDLKENALIKDIFSMIKRGFYEKIGSDADVHVTVNEFKKIDQGEYIVSKIDKDKFNRRIYL